MSLYRRFLRCSVCCLLGMLSGACAAQQFTAQPTVELTVGRVTSFQTGLLQYPGDGVDILYINAPASVNSIQGVVAGELLNQNGSGFQDLGLNHILFAGATNVVATLGKFSSLAKYTDYAFAISGGSSNNLCVYYGTGAGASSQASSYDGGNAYPPAGGVSTCTTLSYAGASNPPNFTAIVPFPFTTGSSPQLLVEDSANGLIYVVTVGPSGIAPKLRIPLNVGQVHVGPGPIYVGDFNSDGNTDFILNDQTNHTATIFFGNGSGMSFTWWPSLYTFTKGIYSMLMQDMDNDGFPDMVAEGKDGSIEIHKGNRDGTFATPSIGGTGAIPSALYGNGGHLAAIDPTNLDILTTTPIGLSVLQGNGSLNYTLKDIYNIGPGRSSFALAKIFGNGSLDLAVDSPEGVAIVQGDALADGGFQASKAYSALAPALGATVGRFRNSANNSSLNMDVVVDTGTTQAQLLTGNGDGTFNTYAAPTNILASPNPALWSNIHSGTFTASGNLDLAYSLTGYPLPTSSTTNIPGLYVQYGNGDSTFQAPAPITSTSVGAQSSNTFYGESVVGQFDSNAIDDIANIDAGYDDTLLGQRSGGFSVGMNQSVTGNTRFNQVAAGFFKSGVTSNQQDLVFQQGANLIPYKNLVNGLGNKFTAMPALTGPLPTASYAVSTVLLTDVNGDGNGDIIALYHNLASDPANPDASKANQLYIWFGDGAGNFGTPQKVSLSRNFYLAAVADMNGDTLPDIVLSDGYLVGILYNQSGGIFKSDFNTCGGVSTCGEKHFLAGQGINSLSLQNVRGGSRPDLIVANGGVTISNPIVLLGNTSPASLNLAANSVVNTGGITVLANNNVSNPVTGTLTASPEPSNYGTTFTITATLTPTAGVALPTGAVNFYFDGMLLGTAYLAPTAGSTTTSSASYTVPAGNTYTGGTHTLTAIYYGDTANSQLNLSGTHSIGDVTTTTNLYLCVSPNPGCPYTGPVPSTPPFNSTLTMSYGQGWNGITQVTASDASTPTGTVVITDAYTGAALPPPVPLCTLPVTGGACDPSVGTTVGTSVGINVLTATYSGDGTHNPSTSPSVTITVSADTTTAALTGSPNPAPLGQPVTFTATLTGNFAAPMGPVVFTYGSTVLCSPSLNLVAGSTANTSTAMCITSSLPAGKDTITASYATTLDFMAASATFSETVTPPIVPSFTISATPNPVSVGVGYAALLTVTVTAQNGFAEGVNLTCGNLPTEATCTFAPATIASGGGTSQLIVLPTAPHSCGSNTPYFVGGTGGGPRLAPLALPALAGMLALFLPGKRRWLRALLVVLLAAGAAQIAGCGNCTDLGTRPGSYTFLVTGTSTGTGTVGSQLVTLNITI